MNEDRLMDVEEKIRVALGEIQNIKDRKAAWDQMAEAIRVKLDSLRTQALEEAHECLLDIEEITDALENMYDIRDGLNAVLNDRDRRERESLEAAHPRQAGW